MKKSVRNLLILGGIFGTTLAIGGSVALASCATSGSTTTQQNNNMGNINNGDLGGSNPGASNKDNVEQNKNPATSENKQETAKQETTKNDKKEDASSTPPSQPTQTPPANKPIQKPTTSGSSSSTTTGNNTTNNSNSGVGIVNPAISSDRSIRNYISNIKTDVEDSSTLFSIKKSTETSREAGQIQKYELTIKTTDEFSKLGKIEFYNEKTGQTYTETTMTVTPGEQISVKVTVNDPETYTLGDLKVFDSANPSVMLETEQLLKTDVYRFTLPNETLDNGKPNPFYETGKLTVRAKFVRAQLNAWTYDFASKTYNIEINKDGYVFDDVAHTNLQLTSGKLNHDASQDEIPGENVIQYRIYLNGHNLEIKNITIPNGAQLMFINNFYNTVDEGRPTPQISLSENTWMFPPEGDQYGKITVQGAIGRWGSVEYSGRLQQYLEPR